jgi:hypothetical protein
MHEYGELGQLVSTARTHEYRVPASGGFSRPSSGYLAIGQRKAKMATKMDKKLYKRVRALGVRKKHARRVAEAAARNSSKTSKAARRVTGSLSGAVVEIQDRLNQGPKKRSAAAKKAAATRKVKAKKRSDAAKKGARSRARADKKETPVETALKSLTPS